MNFANNSSSGENGFYFSTPNVSIFNRIRNGLNSLSRHVVQGCSFVGTHASRVFNYCNTCQCLIDLDDYVNPPRRTVLHDSLIDSSYSVGSREPIITPLPQQVCDEIQDQQLIVLDSNIEPNEDISSDDVPDEGEWIHYHHVGNPVESSGHESNVIEEEDSASLPDDVETIEQVTSSQDISVNDQLERLILPRDIHRSFPNFVAQFILYAPFTHIVNCINNLVADILPYYGSSNFYIRVNSWLRELIYGNDQSMRGVLLTSVNLADTALSNRTCVTLVEFRQLEQIYASCRTAKLYEPATDSDVYTLQMLYGELTPANRMLMVDEQEQPILDENGNPQTRIDNNIVILKTIKIVDQLRRIEPEGFVYAYTGDFAEPPTVEYSVLYSSIVRVFKFIELNQNSEWSYRIWHERLLSLRIDESYTNLTRLFNSCCVAFCHSTGRVINFGIEAASAPFPHPAEQQILRL